MTISGIDIMYISYAIFKQTNMSCCKFWTAAWELRHLWWMVVLWVNLLRLSSGLRSGREVLLSDVLHDWRTTDFCDCLCQFDVDGMLEGFAWDFRNPSNSVVFEDKQLSCSQPCYFSADIWQSLFLLHLRAWVVIAMILVHIRSSFGELLWNLLTNRPTLHHPNPYDSNHCTQHIPKLLASGFGCLYISNKAKIQSISCIQSTESTHIAGLYDSRWQPMAGGQLTKCLRTTLSNYFLSNPIKCWWSGSGQN